MADPPHNPHLPASVDTGPGSRIYSMLRDRVPFPVRINENLFRTAPDAWPLSSNLERTLPDPRDDPALYESAIWSIYQTQRWYNGVNGQLNANDTTNMADADEIEQMMQEQPGEIDIVAMPDADEILQMVQSWRDHLIPSDQTAEAEAEEEEEEEEEVVYYDEEAELDEAEQLKEKKKAEVTCGDGENSSEHVEFKVEPTSGSGEASSGNEPGAEARSVADDAASDISDDDDASQGDEAASNASDLEPILDWVNDESVLNDRWPTPPDPRILFVGARRQFLQEPGNHAARLWSQACRVLKSGNEDELSALMELPHADWERKGSRASTSKSRDAYLVGCYARYIWYFCLRREIEARRRSDTEPSLPDSQEIRSLFEGENAAVHLTLPDIQRQFLDGIEDIPKFVSRLRKVAVQDAATENWISSTTPIPSAPEIRARFLSGTEHSFSLAQIVDWFPNRIASMHALLEQVECVAFREGNLWVLYGVDRLHELIASEEKAMRSLLKLARQVPELVLRWVKTVASYDADQEMWETKPEFQEAWEGATEPAESPRAPSASGHRASPSPPPASQTSHGSSSQKKRKRDAKTDGDDDEDESSDNGEQPPAKRTRAATKAAASKSTTISKQPATKQKVKVAAIRKSARAKAKATSETAPAVKPEALTAPTRRTTRATSAARATSTTVQLVNPPPARKTRAVSMQRGRRGRTAQASTLATIAESPSAQLRERLSHAAPLTGQQLYDLAAGISSDSSVLSTPSTPTPRGPERGSRVAAATAAKKQIEKKGAAGDGSTDDDGTTDVKTKKGASKKEAPKKKENRLKRTLEEEFKKEPGDDDLAIDRVETRAQKRKRRAQGE